MKFKLQTLLFLIVSFMGGCETSMRKDEYTLLCKFSIVSYPNEKYDSKIYKNDSLLIIQNYGLAHSEKIVVDSTYTIIAKGKIIKRDSSFYVSLLPKMKEIPTNEFIKTNCNIKSITSQLSTIDNDELAELGCDSEDITQHGNAEIFIMKTLPNYWEGTTTYVEIYSQPNRNLLG